MAWHPNTLRDYILDGNESPLASRRYRNKEHNPLNYRCPCGDWCLPSRIVDLRNSPQFAEDWGCDGCLSKRMRQAGGRNDQARHNWKRQYRQSIGAPKEVLDRIPK